MDTDLLEGLQIMFIGMGVVGLFLVILVFVMILVSKVVTIIDKAMPIVEQEMAQTIKKIDNTNLAIAIAVAHLGNK